MKRRLILAVTFLLVFQSAVSIAAGVDTRDLLKTRDLQKRWRIDFDEELSDLYINSDSIKMFENGREIFWQYGLENGGKTLVLVPGFKEYGLNKKYRIEFSEKFRSKSGNTLNKKVVIPFEIDLEAEEDLVKDVEPGSSLEELKSLKGSPNRVDRHGEYYWYSYFDSFYRDYRVYHVKNGVVEHILMSKRELVPSKNISWNSRRSDVERALGKSRYDSYVLDGKKYEFMYDKNDSKIVNVIVSRPGHDYWSLPFDESLISIYEKQIFDMSNAFRSKHGRGPYKYSKSASVPAKLHSQDMAKNGFVGHNSSNGDSFETRLRKHGVGYSSAGENAAGGSYMGALGAMQGWINSPGHRQGILGDFEYMGVGGAIGSWNCYTQVFYK